MKTFFATCLLEIRRMLNKRTFALLAAYCLMSVYFVWMGAGNYAGVMANNKNFQDLERSKVHKYITYAQYGGYGFRIRYIPSPLSIYFTNSSAVSELTSNVDAGSKLHIYNSFKGRQLFVEKAGGFKDFSGILLLLGSLMVLYFGYEGFIYKDYLRFMTGFIGSKPVFCSILAARIIVLTLFFTLNAGISLLVLWFKDIVLSGEQTVHLFLFLLVQVLTVLFFFALGTIAGSFRFRFSGFVTILILWFTFVFLIPGAVGSIIEGKADNIASNYHLELENLKILMDFEKRAIEAEGRVKETNTERERELMAHYQKNEVRAIEAHEMQMEKEMRRNIRRFHSLSMLFPSTFYLSAGNEISSKGYNSFTTFFTYIRELKRDFIKFYIEKRYHTNFTKPEHFITDDRNLFYSQSSLPDGFTTGLWLTSFYTVVLLILSFTFFRKSLQQ